MTGTSVTTPASGAPAGSGAPAQAPAPTRRPLSGRFWVLVAAYALSYLGTGLVYPFTALYLVEVRHLGAGTGGLFFGVIAATSFVWAPVAGRLVDAWRPAGVAAAGVLLQGAGYALLSLADNTSLAIGCAILVGLGNGSFYPGITPVLAGMLAPEQRKRGFASRYLAMNLGVGAGAALAGQLVDAFHGVSAYTWLYLADGATFIPFAAALLVLGPRTRREPPAEAGARAGYRTLLASRPLRILLVSQALLVVFGYSQVDTAVPLLLTQRLGLAASIVGVVIAVNTVAVGVLQAPLTRLLEHLPSAPVLALGPAIWTVAAGLGAAATLVGHQPRIVLMIVYAVVFAVGENCYAASYHPLLTEVTPADALGRASAMSSLSWNTGALAGPALGIAIVGSALSPTGYWLIYGALLLVTSGLALSLRRVTAQ